MKDQIKLVRNIISSLNQESEIIINIGEGLELHENSGAVNKDILVISGAGHNDLMLIGQKQYFTKIEEFIKKNS